MSAKGKETHHKLRKLGKRRERKEKREQKIALTGCHREKRKKNGEMVQCLRVEECK